MTGQGNEEAPAFEAWELEAAKASVVEWDKEPLPADPEERAQREAARARMLARFRARFGKAW
jgi:hypothetical protein